MQYAILISCLVFIVSGQVYASERDLRTVLANAIGYDVRNQYPHVEMELAVQRQGCSRNVWRQVNESCAEFLGVLQAQQGSKISEKDDDPLKQLFLHNVADPEAVHTQHGHSIRVHANNAGLSGMLKCMFYRKCMEVNALTSGGWLGSSTAMLHQSFERTADEFNTVQIKFGIQNSGQADTVQLVKKFFAWDQGDLDRVRAIFQSGMSSQMQCDLDGNIIKLLGMGSRDQSHVYVKFKRDNVENNDKEQYVTV